MTDVSRQKGLFITGTDTGVGKTHVTCLIARQLIRQGVRVGVYKPVCSGATTADASPSSSTGDMGRRWDDIDRIRAVLGSHWSDDVICPQRFLAPLAPPIAARLEGTTVDFQMLVGGIRRFADQSLILVEGAGGWLSPVTETQTVADLAQALSFPVLIVARAGLGTINHSLLTIESVRSRRLLPVGVVLNEATPLLNDSSPLTNPAEIESHSGVPVLGTVPFNNSDDLVRDGRIVRVNWRLLADG